MTKLMAFVADPEATVTLSCTATSSFTNLLAATQASEFLVQNTGTALAYVKFGAQSLTATAASLPVLPGSGFVTRRDALIDLFFAGKCDAGNSTILKVTPGTGN